ncbi:ParA family protein [Paradevosia shaoguanensis]|uniref:AAA family ATPase n=1 Tax=Paradevosia shaoguanensis TaxID=1335043 RepID=A0AA41QL52_9HYPH|nr:ParA family protein [Paradevosia shaoguanensis]MCF1742047.1 AAA family ATPase [Paradevosia shaoguanensis]MCI0126530.1 AAA family ATPase [Paradevosia shaoguanensis]
MPLLPTWPHHIAPISRLPHSRGPRVISLLGKGGSSKTTTAIQLAGTGAAIGRRVLILDTDPQRSASGWRALREDTRISVKTCRPQDVADLVSRASQAGIELVLVDNPPVRSAASDAIAAAADLSVVMVRPSMLDLVVGMDWITWLNAANHQFAVVIGAAPPMRAGTEAPFVREARMALRQEVHRLWRGQLTLRHAVIESVGVGATLMETEPDGAAAGEFCRLWIGLMAELERTR